MSILVRVGRYLLVALAGAVVLLAVSPAAATHAAPATGALGQMARSVHLPMLPGDCKEAPLPAMPVGAMGEVGTLPPLIYDEDPFENPDVPIHGVYGWNYQLFTYDNGCGPGAGFLPEAATSISNLALTETSKGASLGHAINSAVLNPIWLDPIDEAVADGVNAVRNATWLPWLGVSVLIVAVLMLWAVRTGVLDAAVTTAIWAFLVLGAVSVIANYPTQTTEAMDGVIQGSATVIVGSFTDPVEQPGDPVDPEKPTPVGERPEGGPAAAPEDPELQVMVDKQWDNIMRNTYWDTWVRATFGDTETPTAKKYAVELFKATHLTWVEALAMKSMPGNEFYEQEIAEKQERFTELAAEIQESDPYTYQYLTGNHWGDRIGQALTGATAGVLAMLFLLVSGIGMFLGFVVIRLAAMFAPAAGVIFLVEKTRNIAIGFVKKIGRYVVMGPVFLLAGLVVLMLNSAIAASEAAWWMKLGLFLVVSWLAWSLIRPVGVITGGGVTKRMFRTMLGTYAGMKLAGRGRKPTDEDDQDQDSKGDSRPSQDQPVHQSVRRPALDPGRTRVGVGQLPPRGEDRDLAEYPIVADHGAEGRVFQSGTRGVSARRARQLSASMNPAASPQRALGPGRVVPEGETDQAVKALPEGTQEQEREADPVSQPVPGGAVVAAVTVVSEDKQAEAADTADAPSTPDRTAVGVAGGGVVPTTQESGRDVPATEIESDTEVPAAAPVPIGVVTVQRVRATDSEQPASKPDEESAGVAGGAITPEPDRGRWADLTESREPTAQEVAEQARQDGTMTIQPVEGTVVEGDIGTVHEANVTYDNSGRPVFTVYRPGGRSVTRDA